MVNIYLAVLEYCFLVVVIFPKIKKVSFLRKIKMLLIFTISVFPRLTYIFDMENYTIAIAKYW